ncbi:Hypothetical protein D9617_17g046740 [Elsinoe fawcettii]|nr:Hypothetical protein D9617_17g046740 [Elsinoe fawcettii]
MRVISYVCSALWLAQCFVEARPQSPPPLEETFFNNRPSQEAFDRETKGLEVAGICRRYRDLWVGKSLEICTVYCGKPNDLACEGSTDAGRIRWSSDPNGDYYTPGKCLCEPPALAKILALEVINALPRVAGVACTAMIGGLNLVLEIGTTVMPDGAAVKGVEKAVSAAKTIVDNGQEIAGFAGWFADVCNPTNSEEVAKINAQVNKVFDPLAAASDSIGLSAGCVMKDKSKCRKTGDSKDIPASAPAANKEPPARTLRTMDNSMPSSAPSRAQPSSASDQSGTTTSKEFAGRTKSTDSHSGTTNTSGPTSPATSSATTASGTSSTSGVSTRGATSSIGSTSKTQTDDSSSGTTSSVSSTTACSITRDASSTTSYLPAVTTAVDICTGLTPCGMIVAQERIEGPGLGDALDQPDEEDSKLLPINSRLQKRGERREFSIRLTEGELVISSLSYPSRTEAFKALAKKNPLHYQKTLDFSTPHLFDYNIEPRDFPSSATEKARFVTEHIVELQTLSDFIKYANTGKITKLPDAPPNAQPLISSKWFSDNWNAEVLPRAKQRKKAEKNTKIPNDRIFDAFGSTTNKGHFVMCEGVLNGAKAKMWAFEEPVTMDVYPKLVDKSAMKSNYAEGGRVKSDPSSREHLSGWMSQLRLITGVVAYMNQAEVKKRMWMTIRDVRVQLKFVDENGPPKTGNFVSLWNDFIDKYFDGLDAHFKSIMTARLLAAKRVFEKARREWEAEQKEKAPCQSGQKRPNDKANSDLPQYLAFGLEGIKKYEAVTLKLKMPREKDLDLDTSIAIDLAEAIKGIDLVGNTPAPVIDLDGLNRAPNLGDFVAAPIGLKTGADAAGNIGGNVAGLAAALAKVKPAVAAPA